MSGNNSGGRKWRAGAGFLSPLFHICAGSNRLLAPIPGFEQAVSFLFRLARLGYFSAHPKYFSLGSNIPPLPATFLDERASVRPLE
jgi:hypothetical protein